MGRGRGTRAHQRERRERRRDERVPSETRPRRVLRPQQGRGLLVRLHGVRAPNCARRGVLGEDDGC